MVLNLRARQTRVWVGGLEVTTILSRCDINSDGFDLLRGIEKASGTLILSAVESLWDYAANPLDPRKDQRWSKSVTVRVEIECGDLQYRLHPRGLLKILRTPAVPDYGATEFQISIGCDLTLNDWQQPAGDKSGLNPNAENANGQAIENGIARHVVINSIGSSIGLPALIDPITSYPLKAPEPQLGGGYVAQIGTIAGAAANVLWVDNQGRLRARAVNLDAAPIATLHHGQHLRVLERSEARENPIDKVVCFANSKESKPVASGGPGDIIAISTTRDYDPSEISTTRFRGFGTRTVTTEQTIERARKLVFPETQLPSSTLITASISTKKTRYSSDDNGFKSAETELIQEPRGKLKPQTSPNSTKPIDAKEIITRYFYNGLVTSRVKKETYEPRFMIVPSSTSEKMELSEWEETRWFAIGDQWGKRVSRVNLKTEESFDETTFSSSQNQPPAPDKYQPPYSTEERRLEGEALFPPIAPNLYPKLEPFEVQTANSEEQLRMMASTIGRIKAAEQFPVTFAVNMRSEFLENWQPLQVVEIAEVSGDRGRYLITKSSWVSTPTESVVACEAIQLSQKLAVTIPPQIPGQPATTITVDVPLWREAEVSKQSTAVTGGITDFVAIVYPDEIATMTITIINPLDAPPFVPDPGPAPEVFGVQTIAIVGGFMP